MKQQPARKQPALVVMDLQRGMFEGAGGPLHEAEKLLRRVGAMIAKARLRGQPIIFVRHDGGPGDELERGTALWPIHPRVAPLSGPGIDEPIVDKTQPSAFAKTDMKKVLQARGIESLVICGAQSDCCIAATAKAARKAGYAVTVVADAHSTFDSRHGKAKDLRAAVNAELAGMGIELVTAKGF